VEQLKRTIGGGVGGGVVWETVQCDIELHGSTKRSLQQRVVQLLSNACALGQTLFKAHLQLSAQLVHPPAKIDQHGEKDCEDAGQPKCSGLPKEKPTRCDCNRCNRATRSWQGVDLDRRLI